MAGLSAEDVPKLKLKWAFGYEDANQAYAQPAIVGGRIFVGSVARKVYSLDAKSGLHLLENQTRTSAVRTAITIGEIAKNRRAGVRVGRLFRRSARATCTPSTLRHGNCCGRQASIRIRTCT